MSIDAHTKDPVVYFASALVMILGIALTLFTRFHHSPLPTQFASYGLLVYGTLGLVIRSNHRITHVPRRFWGQLLRWVSTPQIESLILLWLGWSLLLQPERGNLFLLTQDPFISFVIGLIFIGAGWWMGVQRPDPALYTALTSLRVFYTLTVAVAVPLTDVPLIVIGSYLGSILHGVIAVLVQWALHELAQEVAELKTQVSQLQAD